MCVCAFEWLPRPAVSPLPTSTASHSDLQMSRLCAVSPELDGLDKKSTPNKNGVLTLREQCEHQGKWGKGISRGRDVGVGVEDVGEVLK